ncbi:MAG: hypothetical protein OSA98_19565 [Rubripirellula sp.]|nr:hypothetical protein [Rubripirellula sp.]
MNTARTRLQKITLLAIPLILVFAIPGSAQEITLDASGRGDIEHEDYFEMSMGSGSSVSEASDTPDAYPERLVGDWNIMISWSKNNDELRGFSKTSGEWTALKIPKQTAIEPITNSNCAVVQVDGTMAAYSGITGTWDVLKLSNDYKFRINVGDPAYIETTDNEMLYTFAAANGKWTSPDDPNLGRSNQLSGLSKEQIDQQVREHAKQYRKESSNPDQLRARISKAVAASFDERQAYQKSEVARMQQKLKSIQAAITRRETLRERIIARRVDELLDLNID